MTATCGTNAGYQTHRRRGEPRCADCLAAHATYVTTRRRPHPDQVAIQRAIDGDPPDRLTYAERYAAIRALLGHGYTHRQTAERLRISRRTVHRHSRKDA